MARLEKYGRKYIGKGEGFNLEDFMQNFSSSKRNPDLNNKNKENLTLADIPKVDSSEPRVKTYLKDSNSDD